MDAVRVVIGSACAAVVLACALVVLMPRDTTTDVIVAEPTQDDPDPCAFTTLVCYVRDNPEQQLVQFDLSILGQYDLTVGRREVTGWLAPQALHQIQVAMTAARYESSRTCIQEVYTGSETLGTYGRVVTIEGCDHADPGTEAARELVRATVSALRADANI